MKKSIVIALAIIATAMFSCTKTKDATTKTSSPIFIKMGGEDTDTPILIVKTKNQANIFVPGSYIVLIKGIDTLTGITDETGTYTFYKIGLGAWDAHITHVGYQDINTQILLVDSVTQVVGVFP